MCFNETASITAFAIGSVCLAYTIYKKMYVFSFLYVTIVLMQLVEYYGHLALTTENAKLNKYAAIAGLSLLVIQPIIWALYVCYTHTNNTNIQTMILLTSILFILFSVGLSVIIEKTNNFRSQRLSPGEIVRVCCGVWLACEFGGIWPCYSDTV